jgi:uncharacterized protein (TIGR02284 family)
MTRQGVVQRVAERWTMAGAQDEISAGLNRLIAACKDREHGYETAAEAARNQDLKALLHSYQRQSAEFVAELQAEVKRQRHTPADTGSLTGWLTRGWLHLTALVGGDDGGVIVACEQGEDAARAAYEAALAEPLPGEARAVIERQYAAVKGGHDRLRALQAVAVRPA